MIDAVVLGAGVLVPIQFHSLAPVEAGRPPTLLSPDVDDRIPGMEEVGINWDEGHGAEDVKVGLVRRIDEAVALRLVSRNGHLRFPEAPNGMLQGNELRIRAVAAPQPQGAAPPDAVDWVDVFWSETRLGSLKVFIHDRLHVQARVYFCYPVRRPDGAPLSPDAMRALAARLHHADVIAAFDTVNAIWRPAGVHFEAALAFRGVVQLASMSGVDGAPFIAGLEDPVDRFSFFDAVTKQAPVQSTMRHANVFCVPRFGGAEDSINAWTFPCEPWTGVNPTPDAHPGVFVRLQNQAGRGVWNDTTALGAVLAHELGHLFGMRHPSDEDAHHNNPGARWCSSRRLMMHNVVPSHYLMPHTSRFRPVHGLVDSNVLDARRHVLRFMETRRRTSAHAPPPPLGELITSRGEE